MNDQVHMRLELQGDELKEARRQKGWVRSDVASRLKCSEAVIEALEGGDPGALAPIYLRGFMKSYIRLLEIDSVMAEQLLSNSQDSAPELRSVFPASQAGQPVDRWLRAASYVLASLLVGTLAWQVTHEVARLSQRQAESADVTTNTDNESAAHVNASIAALETLQERTGERGGAAGTQAWAALEQAENAPGGPLQEGEYLLGLSASADSWVEIRDARGELLEQDLVRGGTRRNYRGHGPFTVTFGRTSAIELLINGQSIDLAPFARDDVTQVMLDPEQVLAASALPAGGN